MGRPRTKDVAARAGVSIGTVSNVLNRPDQVSGPMRQRVERAIADLGFVRNESARQLRAGSSRTIAYLALDASNPFFADVARGVEEAAREDDIGVFVCNSDEDPLREQEYLDLLLEQRVRGLLLTPVNHDGDRLRRLTRLGVPVVLIESRTQAGPQWCSVSVDDIEGGDLAVSHLLEQGHRRVAFIGGPLSTVPVADRLAGAVRAVQRAGLDPAVGGPVLTHLPTSALKVGEGRLAAQRLLAVPARHRPTAAFCANDLVALGVLQELTRQGMSVPDDVAIVGYDDIEFAAAAAVPLTSVRQPRQLLGKAAAGLLLDEVAAARTSSSPGVSAHVHRQVQFQPELVVRSSSLRSQAGNPRRTARG